MTLQTFDAESQLLVSATEAFDWHTRPGAFVRLSPPWQRVELEGPAPAIVDGSRLHMWVGPKLLRRRWVAEHSEVVPGRGFVDVQIEGPFARWRHSHRFSALGPAASVMHDHIEYALPGGGIGRWLAGPAIRHELGRLFRYRHATLRDDLALHARYRDRPRLRVAITGASGLLGSALRALLTTGGHRVVSLVRHNREPAHDEARWDPAGGIVDADRIEDLDAVVHLAGANIAAGRWSAARRRAIRDSRVIGTRTLVASLRRLRRPPRQLVSASAVGFYGDRGRDGLDETAQPGRGFLSGVCQDWELEAHSASDIVPRINVVRLGVVLTPAGAALAKMLPPFRLGAGARVGSGQQLVSWISLDDAAGAFLHVLAGPELTGAVNATAPEPVTNRELTRVLGQVLHRPAVARMPARVARLALGEMGQQTLLASTGAIPSALVRSGFVFRHASLTDALRHVLGQQD